MLLDVLPALRVAEPGTLVWASSSTSATVGPAGEDGVEVHLLERRAAVLDRAAGDDLEIAELGLGPRAAVGLDVADDDVGAPFGAGAAFVEHGVGLAHAGRGAEVDPQRAARSWRDHRPSVPSRHRYWSSSFEGEVELEHVDPRLAEEPERPALGVVVDEVEHVVDGEAALVGDPRGLEPGVGDRDVGVEAGARRRDRVDRDRSPSSSPFSRGRRRPAPRTAVEQLGVGRTEVRGAAAAMVRSSGSAGSPSSASDPDAARQRLTGGCGSTPEPLNAWPIEREPTTSPSRSTSEPSALSPKRAWATPVTASG